MTTTHLRGLKVKRRSKMRADKVEVAFSSQVMFFRTSLPRPNVDAAAFGKTKTARVALHPEMVSHSHPKPITFGVAPTVFKGSATRLKRSLRRRASHRVERCFVVFQAL